MYFRDEQGNRIQVPTTPQIQQTPKKIKASTSWYSDPNKLIKWIMFIILVIMTLYLGYDLMIKKHEVP